MMRSIDWAHTSVGPVETWPQSLRTALGILLDSSYPMYIAWGSEYTQFYNDGYRPILGSTKHPGALGESTRTTFAEIWPLIGPMFDRVMREGAPTYLEDQLLPLDRHGYVEECYFTFCYSAIRGERGAVGGVFVTVVETTERVLGERRLSTLRDMAARGMEARTVDAAVSACQSALEANPYDVPFSLTYLLGEDGSSARLAGVTGLDPGGPAAPLVLDLNDSTWPLHEAMSAGRPVAADMARQGLDLACGPWPERPSSAVVVPITAAGQTRPAGFLVCGVNARRALDDGYLGFHALAAAQIAAGIANASAYEEAARRAEMLAELDRAKTAFFSNVSHEFRTPLTLLLGPLEEVRSDPSTPPSTREKLDLAHRNGLRLLRLVNTLLDFSRVEAGRVDASFEPLDLASYTAELASTFRSALERAGLTLTVHCPPLPEPVYADGDMWEKIVLNLMSNAFKHTFDGGVAVHLRAVDGAAELSVYDTGVGIPTEELGRVFERFHRVPGTSARTHEGSGIGLALVQEMVHLHGGAVEVESALSEGTTFRVKIPFGHTHLPPDRLGAPRRRASTALGAEPFIEEALRWLPARTPPAADSAAYPVAEGHEGARRPGRSGTEAVAAPHPRGRVLLADDNADMSDYVSRLLRQDGWGVESVRNGRQALERIRTDPPDLVLTDVMMPEMDGFGLLRAIRLDPASASLPVILLSARAGEESHVEGLEAGADDYLVKPFAAQELIARVGAHFGLSRQRRLASEMRTRFLNEERALVETVQKVGEALTSHLDLSAVVQSVTDEATKLTGAQFGAFFYNRISEAGEAYSLYTISGAPKEAFARFPHPRNTEVFEPTFRGTSTVRSEDITKDPRYGKNAPYHGLPRGHLPVRSYLAVPVISRGGEVLGGLFFGHAKPGVFTESHERLVTGIAGWAAVAIENASLYEAERRARQEADAARAEAEHANRAKTDFLATMSHELRTPLNAIAGYVELLQLEIRGPLTSQQHEDLRRIRRSQQHLLALINDVLNLARLEAGNLTLQIDDVPVCPALSDLEVLVGGQAAAKQLSFLVMPCDESLYVRADDERLRQILLNLVTNAVKFTPEGGSVTVRAIPRADWVEIDVTDTGRGIPRSMHASIFEPFIQLERGTSSEQGIGLGLAISRDLARLMDGDITVRSREGRGSIFTVRLPSGR